MAEVKHDFLNSKVDDDDDNDDLFVSAIESHSKPTSNDSTIKSLTPTMEDVLNIGDEIDLKDDDEDDQNKDQLKNVTDDKNLEEIDITQSSDNESLIKIQPLIKILPKSTFYDGNNEKVENNGGNDFDDKKATLQTTSISTLNETNAFNKPVEELTNKNDKIPSVAVTSEMVDEHFIEVKVDSPNKVGEGMSSYMVYKLTTKTNLPFFRKTSFEVNRRFSDFLGLRTKLVEKHLHLGRIVPPAPDKDAMNTAKVKMAKEDNNSQSDFIEKRRHSLERFINRIAIHPILRTDPDFREFLQLETELPKATNTSALSGASVKKLFNRVGDTVNKMTFRMDESDPWFEEKQNQIESLDTQLRKLYSSVDALIHHRKELTLCTGSFAKSAAMLGNCEEHTSLSCALSQLAETEEKVEQLHSEQTNNDYLYLFDLIKDYIALIGSVKDVFHQRVKVFQTWQHAQQTLIKKREQKAKFELTGKTDRISLANDEVIEWESKVGRGREEFENISKTIKTEVEKFELNRIKDFKNNIIKYMETLLETQNKLIKYWEAFLPEAKAIA